VWRRPPRRWRWRSATRRSNRGGLR
jgi:hypothetical protein